MLKKFCPKCGKETKTFVKGLCLDCYLEKLKIENKIPKEIVINQCPLCKDFILKNRNLKFDEAVKYLIKDFLKKIPIKDFEYKIEDNILHLIINLKVDHKIKNLEKAVKLKIKKTYCKFCRLKISGYYEGIIQLRNLPENKIQEIINLIKKIEKKNRMAFISKEERLKNGLNLYVGSKNVINILKKKFEYKTKVSKKLYGIKNGKKVYRVTLLISGKNG